MLVADYERVAYELLSRSLREKLKELIRNNVPKIEIMFGIPISEESYDVVRKNEQRGNNQGKCEGVKRLSTTTGVKSYNKNRSSYR